LRTVQKKKAVQGEQLFFEYFSINRISNGDLLFQHSF